MAEKSPERRRFRVINGGKPAELQDNNMNAATRRVLEAFKVARRNLASEIERIDAKGEKVQAHERPTTAPETNRESPRKEIWQRLKTEGINSRNLREFANNAELFTSHELEIILTIVKSLLMEWDPAFHPFLRSLIPELEEMRTIKGRLESSRVE